MKSKALARFLTVFLIVTVAINFLWLERVSGAVETQTRTVSQTSDDGFVTEIGVLFDGPLVTILDPGMDIRSFVIFRDIEINAWERLENATLRLRSAGVMGYGASTISIHGIQRAGHYLPIDAADVHSVPLTASSANANTTFFYGSATLDVDVTNIMREFMSHQDWTGDGTSGTGTGDTIGFLILGAEGHPSRVFYDESAGNGLEARIILYWGETPAPPSTDAPDGFNDTSVYTWTEEENTTVPYIGDGDYNETIDVWRVDAFGPPEFEYVGFHLDNTAYYHNSTTGTTGDVELDGPWDHPVEGAATSPILSLGQWTLLMGDPGNLAIYISDDGFLTNNSYRPNLEYTALDAFGSNIGSLAVDRGIGNLVHLVYTSVTPAQNAVYNVVYTNFTLDMVTGVPTFALTFTNLTQVGSTQFAPVIHVQENGTLHVVWYGIDGTVELAVWYRRRHTNQTWLPQVRISDTDVGGFLNVWPDVVANDETGVALVVFEYDRDQVHWDVVYPNNTADVDREETGSARALTPSMVMDRERNEALMVWESSTGQPGVIYFQNKTIDNATAWSVKKAVSPGGQKHFEPDIGIETENGTIQVIWYDDWNLKVSGNYWNILNDPIPVATTISTTQMREVFIEEEFERSILNTTYFVAWGNGTLISGPLDDLDAVDEFLEDEFGVDPEDPDPASQDWETTGPFTRFGVRVYIFLIGVFLFWGPLVVMATGRPTGYQFVIGCLIMLVGVAFLIAVGSV